MWQAMEIVIPKKKAAITGSPEIFMQALCFAFPVPRNGVLQ